MNAEGAAPAPGPMRDPRSPARPPARPGARQRTLRVLRTALVALCAVLLAGALGLEALERTGRLRELVAGWLARAFAPTAHEVSVGRVRLSWAPPGLELEDLALQAREPGAPELLRVERLRLAVGLNDGRPALRAVHARGGGTVLGEELVRTLAAARFGDDGPRTETPAVLPSVQLRDLAVSAALPDGSVLPLGSLDLVLDRDATGRPALDGRLVPSWTAAEAGPVEIHLGGDLVGTRMLRVRASAREALLDPASLPAGSMGDRLRARLGPFTLSFAGSGTIHLDGSRPARAELRASVHGASWLPPSAAQPIEDLSLELSASHRGRGPSSSLLEAGLWDVDALLEGRWRGAELSLRGRSGRGAEHDARARTGAAPRAWASVRGLPLDEATLALAGPDPGGGIRRVWDALAPAGSADVWLGARWPRGVRELPELALEARTAEDGAGVRVAYHGWPKSTGEPQGFPMPVVMTGGRVVATFDPRGEPLAHLALVELSGSASGGRAEGGGLLSWPDRSDDRPRVDLTFETPGARVDGAIGRALDGLSGAEWVWDTFSPEGGTVAARAHLVRPAPEGPTLARVELHVSDGALAWSGLPVDLAGVRGRIDIDVESGAGAGVRFRLDGRTPTAESVGVSGRVQIDPAAEEAGLRGVEQQVHAIEVRARDLSLRGVDRDVIATTWSGVGRALDNLNPSGRVDLRYRGGRNAGPESMGFEVEVVPRVVRFTPPVFPVQTSEVQGRVLVHGRSRPVPERAGSGLADDGARVARETIIETRIAPLSGVWAGGVRVALSGLVTTHDDEREYELRAFGAGIDPSNMNLVGVLGRALEAAGASPQFNLSQIRFGGRVDAVAEVLGSARADGEVEVRVLLRENDFALESGGPEGGEPFRLDDVEGAVLLRGGELQGERIEALLGRTPVVLVEPRLSSGGGGLRLETGLEAELPIDREHLRYFLDGETIDALVERSGWSGRLAIDRARLSMLVAQGRGGRLELSGRVLPINMFVRFGVPLLIQSAEVDVRQLVVENGNVRAWAVVEDLFGQLAGRQLERARMTLGYEEPRLTIQELEGGLEGGSIAGLESEGASTAFAIELQRPFPFELALALDRVPVEGMLRGAVEANLGNKGTLTSQLVLRGSLDDLAGLRGGGNLSLRNARLWSIPVVRDILALFGLDGSAVFESFKTSFRLSDGVITMKAIQAKSPLVRLVGEGTLQLDGQLSQELRPRFSIVENLAPLKRIGREIQDSLLRLEIRGDMARPRVEKRSILSDLLAPLFLWRRRDAGERDLPLPSYSTLPERF